MSTSVSKPAQDAGGAVEVIADITEQTIRFESAGSGEMGMQVGDGATFFNNIYDSDDNIVGNTVGLVIAVSKRPSDGHVITEYAEVIKLHDGTLRSSGSVDRIALWTGNPIVLDVVGTSGSYLGKRGVRECRLLPPFPPSVDSRVSIRITLSADC
jgi:hypothetical protein